ncbi:unnamed protein product [Sphenostylis stenocarpa]|uniref:F-box associated beta-propeller type 1 domain-containing protein n=1 Tax=Sphenostylis stenocarpa TaxID=92480 RepID=A0AA86VG92_9FABA|nr:unnamed protein product [Sphenostylis stenocarpa]
MFLQGFGYDPSTNDYLLIHVFQSLDNPANYIEFFSLKENMWKEVDATSFTCKNNHNYCFDTQSGIALNDSIHWLASCPDTDIPIDVIIAFDLRKRNIFQIPLPPNFEADFSHICILGELLNIVKGYNFHSIEIWAMQKYKVQLSWSKTIVVSIDDIQMLYFSPICSTKSGDIVGDNGYDALAKCDNKGKFKEFRRYFGGQFGLHTTMLTYTETLLSLPCANEQAAEGTRSIIS